MKYSDAALNLVMALLEKKMKEFRNPGWTAWDDYDKKWDVEGIRTYIENLGGSLFENPYPPQSDSMDDEEWEALCDRRLAEIEAETGMFPVLLPHRCGKYQACLLPGETVGRILALRMFP